VVFKGRKTIDDVPMHVLQTPSMPGYPQASKVAQTARR
jgi:hypothetical protein